MNLKRFEKRTKYDKGKQNKKDNYTHLNKNHCKKGQVVLTGDSITDEYNYYELFAPFCEKTGLMVYNRGISGDTSNRLLQRLYDNVLSIEPCKLVYLIGTNDIACGADNNYIRDNIKRLILKTREHCPGCEIAVQSVYPVIDHRQRHNKDIKPLNLLLKALCDEMEVTYIDLYNSLCDRNGQFNRNYTYDGLHPNIIGYEVTTKAITDFLMK